MPALVIHPGKGPSRLGRFYIQTKAFPSAGRLITASITEAGTAVDASVAMMPVGIVEAGTAADSSVATQALGVAIIESGNAAESTDALKSFGIGVIETLSATDFLSGIVDSNPTLPAYMPYPMIGGFQQTSDFAMLVTQMDSGPDKQRPRYSVPVIQRSVQYGLPSLANRNAFELWVRDTLVGGSLYFNWPDPLTGTTKPVRIVGGKVNYTMESGGCSWIIQFNIEAYS